MKSFLWQISRRAGRSWANGGVMFWFCCVVFCMAAGVVAGVTVEPRYEPGDVFVTRNHAEKDNTSPGHWNHAAVYVGIDKNTHRGLVVEAQKDAGGVIYSDLEEFTQRYPQILVLRLRGRSLQERAKVAEAACGQVGTPYRFSASLRPRRMPPRSNNCVSVIRRSCFPVFLKDAGWQRPDDVIDMRVFEIMFSKPSLVF